MGGLLHVELLKIFTPPYPLVSVGITGTT